MTTPAEIRELADRLERCNYCIDTYRPEIVSALRDAANLIEDQNERIANIDHLSSFDRCPRGLRGDPQ